MFFLPGGAPPKESGSCGSYLAPSPSLPHQHLLSAQAWQTSSGFTPPLKYNRQARSGLHNRENRWKEAKPVWQVLCANTILCGSGSETKVRGGPVSLSDPLLGDNSTSCASLRPYMARALEFLPVTYDQLCPTPLSKAPPKPGVRLKPACGRSLHA